MGDDKALALPVKEPPELNRDVLNYEPTKSRRKQRLNLGLASLITMLFQFVNCVAIVRIGPYSTLRANFADSIGSVAAVALLWWLTPTAFVLACVSFKTDGVMRNVPAVLGFTLATAVMVVALGTWLN